MQSKSNSKQSRKRPNKRSFRSSSKFSSKREDSEVESKTNDPQWYTANPALLQGAANLFLSNAAGLPIRRDMRMMTSPPGFEMKSYFNWSSPGILSIGIMPFPSGEKNSADAMNVAATSLYSFVRHANSGSSNYDAPDLMMYCIAMGQIYALINFCARVYGTARLYSHQNRYFPRAIIGAQNVDYDDLMGNLAQFRYNLNSLIYKASSLAVPADIPYFKRTAFLFSGLYAEGESVRDQLYVTYPTDFLKFNETGSSHGGSLGQVPFKNPSDSNYLKVSTIFSIANELLDAIIKSEDMNIMSGDILKAYNGNILKLTTVDENFTVLPTTDLAVLEQIQNGDIVAIHLNDGADDGWSAKLNGSITQDPNTGLLWPAVWLTSSQEVAYNVLAAPLNTHVLTTILTDPKPEDIIERTRYMTTILPPSEPAGHPSTWVLKNGTEIMKSASVVYLDEQGVVRFYPVVGVSVTSDGYMQTQYNSTVNLHCLLESFKFHPAIHYFQFRNDNTLMYVNTAIDLDNYAVIERSTLDHLNDEAKLSLFFVPQIARF